MRLPIFHFQACLGGKANPSIGLAFSFISSLCYRQTYERILTAPPCRLFPFFCFLPADMRFQPSSVHRGAHLDFLYLNFVLRCLHSRRYIFCCLSSDLREWLSYPQRLNAPDSGEKDMKENSCPRLSLLQLLSLSLTLFQENSC